VIVKTEPKDMSSKTFKKQAMYTNDDWNYVVEKQIYPNTKII